MIITIVIVSESAQVCAISADNIDLAAMIIAIVVEISSEYYPLAIWGERGALAVPAAWRELVRVRAVGIQDIDFPVPGWTNIRDNGFAIR